MSPFVLVVAISIGNGGAAVAIDMPSQQVCEAARDKIADESTPPTAAACIDRRKPPRRHQTAIDALLFRNGITEQWKPLITVAREMFRRL